MPDTNTQQQQIPGTDSAAVAPPPPAAALEAAPPARKPKVKAKPEQHEQRRGSSDIVIPQGAFKARVQREAAVIVQRRLGVSLDEAEKIVKAGGQPGASASDTATAALRLENERLRKDRDKLKRESEDRVRKAEKSARRAGDRAITAEMRAEARLAGVVDADYAVHLLAKAALKDETIDPGAFFGGLKKTHPHLFTQAVEPPPPAAPPPTLAATTAPPESPAVGGVKPAPAAAGSPPVTVDAEAMSDADFHAHQRNYGFVPGM
jgi:hypothetical protein